MGRELRFGSVLSRLVDERYPRQRKVLADALDVSVAALSQWERGSSKPSFDNLIALAEILGVSLDLLVFDDPVGPIAPDSGAAMAHFEQAQLKAESRWRSTEDLLTRVSTRLADMIHHEVKAVVDDEHSLIGKSKGALTFDEIVVLESHARSISIATTDFGLDVIEFAVDGGGQSAAGGPLVQVIAQNLKNRCGYRYLIPGSGPMIESARALMAVVGMICRDRTVSDELRCRSTREAFGVPGFIIYSLDETMLTRDHGELAGRVDGYISDGLVAVAEPSNREFLYYQLIPEEYLASLLAWFERAWAAAVDVES